MRYLLAVSIAVALMTLCTLELGAELRAVKTANAPGFDRSSCQTYRSSAFELDAAVVPCGRP